MARPRLTPLLKDTEVLGQENIDNTSLPTQQDPTKPLRLRPSSVAAPTVPILGTKEIDDPFGENYAELDRDITSERNLEAQLAEEQGGSRWLNALGQFSNEVALGTVSGIGMLLDYENVGEGLTAGESDFGNWFSDAVDKVKEDLNKEMPTYRSEAAQTGWAPFDSTWWADNAATLGTTLSLMAPVAGAMRIPGAIGKFMRGAAAGSKVAKGVKSSNKAIRGLNKLLYGTETAGILEQGGSAVISRYLESTMEAHENFKGVEQELLAQGYSEEEAKAKAGEAARDVWQANWLNLAQDVFQYRTLSKGMSAASRASKEFRKGVLSQGGEFLKTMASEGAEEFGQYVIGEEATRAALDDKKSFFELGGLGTRLYDYIQEPEAKAAMLLGAAGGGMFHAISSTPEVYGRLSGTYDAKEAALAKQTALDQLDINTSYLVDGSTLLNQAIEYSANGKLNDLRDFYSSFAEMSDQELEAQGLSSEEIADKRKKDAQILEDIDFLGEEFSRVMDDSSRSDIVKLQEIASLYEKHKLSQSKGDINEKLNEETSKVLETDQISEQKLNVKRNGYKLNFYKVYREIFKKQSKDKEGFDKSLEQIDKNIELLEKQIASDKESLASSETETSDIPLTTRDSEIAALEEQIVINDLQNIGADRVLQNAHTEKGQKELLTEHEQREVDATLKKISPTSDIKFLKALANPNNKNPKGWDKIKAKLKGIADKAEVDLSPAIAGSESFEADLAKRYANTPLLFREMLQIQNKLTSEQDISEVKRIFTAEQFSNLYANNKNVAAAFDSLMSEKKSKYVKADLEGQIDPETTFVDPENPTDNTPTENPEGPVVYTPEGNPSIPGEAMIFSNAVVLYTYNAKTGVVKFSGLENHKDPMKLEDAIKLMDSLGYDSRFISSTKGAGAYRVLLTSDGQAIPSEFNSVKINGESVKLLSDEELKIINDPESKLLGGKIKFSVPRDADVNKDPNTTADNFLIVLSTEIEVDGEMKEVKLGTLGATKNGANNTDAVKRLRDTIFTEFKQSELQPAPTTQQTSEAKVPKLTTVKVDLSNLSESELKNVVKQLRQKEVAAKEAEKQGKAVLGGSAAITADKNAVKKYLSEKFKPTQQSSDKRQKELDDAIAEADAEVAALRESDGSVSKENEAAFKKALKKRSGLQSVGEENKVKFSLPSKNKIGKDSTWLSEKQAALADKIIQAIIDSGLKEGLSAQEISDQIINRHAFKLPQVQAIKYYVAGLVNNTTEQGNSKQSFAAWRKGEFDATTAPTTEAAPTTEVQPGVFTSSVDNVIIGDRTRGLFNSGWSKPSVPVHDALGDDFAMGVVNVDANGNVVFITKNIERHIDDTKKISNGNTSFYKNHKGNVIAYVKTAKGLYIPVRLQTTKLDELPTEENAVHDIINELYDAYENGDLTPKPKSNTVKGVEIAEENKAVYAKIKEFNKKLLGYIPMRLAINTTIGGKIVLSTRRDAKGNNVLDTNPITREEALKYASGKTMRVDERKINTGNYNKELSEKGWIRVNLDIEAPMVASDVVAKIGSLPVAPQIKGVTDVAQPSQPPQPTAPPLSNEPIHPNDAAWERLIASRKAAKEGKPAEKTTVKKEPSKKGVKTVTIAKDANSNFNVDVNMKDGSVTFTKSGNPLDSNKDARLINKAHLRSEYVSYEIFPYNNQRYAITSDDRIINITPDGKSIGAEVKWSGPVGKAIRKSQEETIPNEPETIEVPEIGGAIDFTGVDSSIGEDEGASDKGDSRDGGVVPGDDIFKWKEASDPEGSYEKWDEEKETAWFKENYPDVPFEVLKDLREIAGKGPNRYWGVFTNASVFIAQQAKTGTAYHEAFHAVFNLMLSDKERSQILKEGSRFAKGAINIEEHWADEFMEYQLSDGNTAHTLPEKVADFFKRLWHTIKIITERTGLTKAASMNDYMYRVSRGLYAKGLVKKFGGVNFKRDVTRFSKQSENKSDYLNIREEEIGKRVMNAILINDILPAYRNLFKIPDASNGDVIKRVINEGMKRKDPSLSIEGLYKNVYQIIDTRKNKSRNLETKMLLGRFLDSIATKNEASGGLAMKPLFARAARALGHYGIKMSITLDTLSTTKDNLGEDMLLEENEELIENWMVKEKFISNKEKFSQKAKALFAQVPLRNEKFGSFTVYEQPSHVFNKLTSKLSSSRSLSDMMSKLDQLVKFNPAYKVIQDAFGDPTVATEFWKNMGQRSFTPFLSMTSGKGKSRTFVGNSQDASKDITERWAAEFRDSSIYNAKDSKVIPPKDFGKRVVQLEDLKNKVIKDVQDKPLEADGNVSREDALKLSNALKVIKMPIPHAEILEMFSDRDAGIENTTGGKDRFVKFTTALVNHMKTIERGADPFSGAIESNKYLTDIIETYLNVFPSLYQKTFKSGTNELIYSMLQSRFMQKMERELNNPNFQERKAFIENYMQDPFYRNSPFFKTLLEESVVGDKLNIAVFDALKTDESNDAIEYSKLTPQQLEAVKINAFFNQQFDSVKDSTDYGYFMMPILSDSTSAAFMYFKKYTKEEAREGLVDSARQERDRIEWLDSRVNPVREEYNKWLADQFDRNVKHKDKAPLPAQLKDIPYSILKNGLKYQIFTDLNKDGIDLTGDNFEKEVMKMVNAAVKSEGDALLNEGILKRDKDGNLQDAIGVIDERFLDPDVARENVNTYLYNTMLMNVQTLVTFGGDVAFYKSKDGNVDFTDVYKRIKEIWSPGDYLNADVSNTFTYTSDEKSETVTVSDTYGTLYINDPDSVEHVVSEHIEFIKEVHKDNPRKDEIVKEFEELNETDAATIIDPIRAREIELGTRGLTNEKYEFYESLMESGKPIEHVGSDHINVVYKPFQFFHDKATDVLGTTRMNPTQHKNAEFLVTPAMAVGNPKLEKAMEKFGYSFNKDGSWTYNPKNRITDSIMFTTAVKVGEVGSIDSIANAVSDDVHFFANENYRIQMETPEHHIDTDVIEGVQYRKLIIENVDPAHEYTLPDGTPILGAQLIKEYNEAIYENVKEGYENLKKEFYNEETGLPDNEKIINALREQVIEQEKPEDMLRALDWLDVNKGMEIGPNGDLIEAGRETVLPLWHPDIVYQVESMMNSFFKKKIAKQKTEKGGGASLYNASSYGLSAENPKGYRKPKIVLNDEGGIAYFEAIMPVTMSALEDYADENGLIDITKIEGIDEDILKGIFYRIPTEHKYSMFHIKVIGFLPAGVGGQIILPEEATTIAGLDFDIDKLYGLLYNIEEYGEPLPEKEIDYQIWKNTPSFSPKANKDIVRADIDNFDDTRGRREFASKENIRWDEKNDQFTEKKTLRKIPSGMDTKASRDNLKLDLATAVLSNKRTAEETLTPGGFKTIEETVDFILELSGQTKGKLNPMLNSTGREVFNRNMTGLDLIGIFANHTANHALMTLGNVFFPIKKIKNADGTERTIDYGITFNGQTLRNLSQMQVKDANIMDLKQFLAAAVDNGKNPLASFLNLTTVTADTVATMVRVGFPIESVLMFSANPALKKMTTDLSKIGNTYRESQEEVLSLQMRELIDGIKDIMFPKNYKDSDFNKILSLLDSTELTYSKETKEGTLTDSIKKSNKTIEDLIKDKDTTELAIRYNALALYKKTNLINSEPLAQIMGQMRYDSSNNAAGPTIAHNKAKVLKHQKLGDIVTIEGWDLLLANNSDNPARHVAAFYRHGIVDASRITGEVTDIPYASTKNNIFNAGLDSFIGNVLPSGRNLKPEDINQFYRAIETMLGTSYPTFKLKEMRRVIETLPSRLTSFANENPDSPYTTFLRHFNPQKSKVVDFKILRYNRNGVDAVQKQEMKNMLLEMLNDSNEEISALGHDLIKYAFATTGYIETPYKFTDLIPSDYTSALQEDGNVRYVEHLKKLYNKVFDLYIQKDANTINNVLDQIVRNRYRHLPLKYLDIESQNNTHFIKNNVLEILVPVSMMSGSAPKSLLRYAKSAYEKNGKMTSVPMKFTGEITEEEQMVFKEIPRAGADNEIIEMSYDDAVNNIPLISEIESYDYIPTEAEKNADFSKVPLNQVSATEALLAASELMPGLNFENIEKLSSANRDTHPFMIALNNLSLPQKQQLRDIVGEKSTMSNSLLNRLIALSNEKVPTPSAPGVSTGTTQPTNENRKYTPENITNLEPNQVFVFGANTAGGHGGGTAGLAQRGNTKSNYTALPQGTKGKWAEYGVVDQLMEGTEGKSFGIVTKAASVSGTKLKIGSRRSVPLERIEQSINSLIETANNNPELEFLVTKFGTNMAGFTVAEMKSLLEGKSLPDNIILPKEFETRPVQPTTAAQPITPTAVSTTFKDTFTVEEQQRIIENFALKYLKGDEAKALDYINDAFSKANDTTVKVISGGQTGVDQLGLTVATSLGIKTGGTAPKGFKTETGNDESLADFGLTESSSSGYPARTEDNVRNSDGTVYFALDTSSAGLLATKAFAEKHGKPFILNPNETTLREWVKTNNVATLNIAGNRASKIPSNRLKDIEVLLKNALKSSDSIINKLKECY